MLCDTPPKVGKRSPQAKRPLNGEQTLRWVTVESQGSKGSSSKSRPRLRVGEYHLGAAVLHHCVTSVLVSLVDDCSSNVKPQLPDSYPRHEFMQAHTDSFSIFTRV